MAKVNENFVEPILRFMKENKIDSCNFHGINATKKDLLEQRKEMKNKKGFTLIEIMIVTIIIGLLITLVFPSVNRARIESNQAYAKATLNTISKSLEIYNSVHNEYPSNINDLFIADPPYLKADYFGSQFKGYVYTQVISNVEYVITATPIGDNHKTFTITTGAILTEGE